VAAVPQVDQQILMSPKPLTTPTVKEIFWHAIVLNQNFKTRALPQVNSPVVVVTALVPKCGGVSFVGDHTDFWFARIKRLIPDPGI